MAKRGRRRAGPNSEAHRTPVLNSNNSATSTTATTSLRSSSTTASTTPFIPPDHTPHRQTPDITSTTSLHPVMPPGDPLSTSPRATSRLHIIPGLNLPTQPSPRPRKPSPAALRAAHALRTLTSQTRLEGRYGAFTALAARVGDCDDPEWVPPEEEVDKQRRKLWDKLDAQLRVDLSLEGGQIVADVRLEKRPEDGGNLEEDLEFESCERGVRETLWGIKILNEAADVTVRMQKGRDEEMEKLVEEARRLNGKS